MFPWVSGYAAIALIYGVRCYFRTNDVAVKQAINRLSTSEERMPAVFAAAIVGLIWPYVIVARIFR